MHIPQLLVALWQEVHVRLALPWQSARRIAVGLEEIPYDALIYPDNRGSCFFSFQSICCGENKLN